MAPLFAAIAHGCAAGRHDEAFNEVYWPRIARGDEKFATRKLGLYGSELSAIAHFFAQPFARPAPGLSAADQALVLNLAGFHLRALGRLADAVAPMRVGARLQADQQDWSNAASGASNLAELLQTLGRLGDGGPAAAGEAATREAGAVTSAAAAVAYADQSGDAFWRMSEPHHPRRRAARRRPLDRGQRAFCRRRGTAARRQAELPLLYSLQGYQWCDLKLAQGRAWEVGVRARHIVAWRQAANSLLDSALDTLSLGRAAHLAAAGDMMFISAKPPAPELTSGSAAEMNFVSPEVRAGDKTWGHRVHRRRDVIAHRRPPRQGGDEHYVPIPARLRRRGAAGGWQHDHIPRGLLARAAWARDLRAAQEAAGQPLTDGTDQASQDLREVFDIATRGGMRLFLAEAWLESAWQRLARRAPTAVGLTFAAEALDKAAALIAETGYNRRLPDLALARAALQFARSESVEGRRQLAQVIAAMRAHNLWGFLPQVERLAARHGLADLAPELAELREIRARFDAQADAAFEAARIEWGQTPERAAGWSVARPGV